MHIACTAENRGHAQADRPVVSQADGWACVLLRLHLHKNESCAHFRSMSTCSCIARASAGTVLRAAHETKLTAAARCGCALALAVRSASIPGSETRELGGRKFTIYKVPSPMLCFLAPVECHV